MCNILLRVFSSFYCSLLNSSNLSDTFSFSHILVLKFQVLTFSSLTISIVFNFTIQCILSFTNCSPTTIFPAIPYPKHRFKMPKFTSFSVAFIRKRNKLNGFIGIGIQRIANCTHLQIKLL